MLSEGLTKSGSLLSQRQEEFLPVTVGGQRVCATEPWRINDVPSRRKACRKTVKETGSARQRVSARALVRDG